MNKKMKIFCYLKKYILKVIFTFIVVGIFIKLQYCFAVEDKRNVQWVADFNNERKNSLDAVYIGGSNAYAFFEAPIAYEHYGITVRPLCANGLPLCAIKYFIIEAENKQKQSLFIVGLNSFDSECTPDRIHFATDYMRFSKNKINLIKRMCDEGGIRGIDRLEFYFPVIRFHNRWEQLKSVDLVRKFDDVKGASNYGGFYKVKEVNELTKPNEIGAENKSNPYVETLIDLIDYCKSNNVNVIFVVSPQADREDQYWGQLNYLCDVVKNAGYDVVDMMDNVDAEGLDVHTDFYNKLHTNIHGAVKTTDYLAKWLVDHYDLQDKRGMPEYADWDEAYKKYADILSKHALPFEYSSNKRSYNLEVPSLNLESDDLQWNEIVGCDGYGIFSKDKGGAWDLLDEVDATTLAWTDPSYSEGRIYTVVAFSKQESDIYWGKSDVNNNG